MFDRLTEPADSASVEELIERARAEGERAGEVKRAVSCLCAIMPDIDGVEAAIERTRTLMGDMDANLFSKAVQEVLERKRATGLPETLGERYEREHRQALVEQACADGLADMVHDFFAGAKRNGLDLGGALQMSDALLSNISRTLREDTAKQVFSEES